MSARRAITENTAALMHQSHQSVATWSCSTAVDFSLNRQFYHSAAAGPALRIGVMIDGDQVPAFARQILDDIAASNFAHTVCFIRNSADAAPSTKPKTRLQWLVRHLSSSASWRAIGYLVYQKYLDARFKPYPDPTASVDCSDLMQNTSIIDVKPLKSRFIDRLCADDLSAVANQRLDVILRFGFRILHGPILTQARYGIWSYHHGDPTRYRGAPPYLWELIENAPTSGAVLQALNETLDGGTVLAEAHFPTSPFPSMSRNGFNPYWSTTHFVIRCLNQLHNALPTNIDALGRTQILEKLRPIYKTPSNLDVAYWLATTALKRAKRRLSRPAQSGPWRIALRKTHVPLYMDPSREALEEFKWLPGRPDGFWADPFLIDRDGSSWLYFENFETLKNKATLSVARITDAGDLEDLRTALERDYHLSYPHVFAHAGEVFMIPESAQAGTVDLYRARHFPHDWVRECTLLNLRTVDSTVFEHEGRWYMFSSPITVAGAVPLTYLWSAPSLTGPWKLVTSQPLDTNPLRARSAGPIFSHDGVVWRPSQDCSTTYGDGLAFNKIESLQMAPRERESIFIEAAVLPGLSHLHSYSRAGEWEAIDGRLKER